MLFPHFQTNTACRRLARRSHIPGRRGHTRCLPRTRTSATQSHHSPARPHRPLPSPITTSLSALPQHLYTAVALSLTADRTHQLDPHDAAKEERGWVDEKEVRANDASMMSIHINGLPAAGRCSSGPRSPIHLTPLIVDLKPRT